MRSCLLGLVLLGLACGRQPGASGRDSTLQRVLSNGELVVGIELGFPPFEVLGEKGTVEGFDIDLARAFAIDLGVTARFETMKWTALTTALQTGQIDMIWSGMTATVPRSTRLLFSDTYFRTRLCLLVRADSGIHGPEDLEGKKLIVKMGTTGVSVAKNLFPENERIELPNENNCALEVTGGGADAFLYDRFSILRHHAKYPKATRVIEVKETFEPYAVAMRPGDFELWRTLNLFLEKVRWDGRYDAIHLKHFGTLPDDSR
jgi:polar amino acid transport system substrate-binding protein